MIVDSRIHGILSQWEAAAPDERPTPEELCAECPELLPEVREQIARLSSVDRHLASDCAQAAPPTVPGYEVLGVLGRGGMGVVWRATQLATKREVAMKTVAAGAFASPRSRARFEREVELASRLSHPHIARVYDSGVAGGVTYYVMELIDGVSLDEFVHRQRLSRAQVIGLMIPICAAVQHAHQFGVIHRDLKPGNVMVTADGKPHLLDFGLAKELWASGPADVTLDAAPGTPAYMAPEQAAGQMEAIGTRSDVYSLGVILYRLLLGCLPHDPSGSPVQLMRRIAGEQPRHPLAVDPKFSRELSAVLLKSLARDPRDRYSSAAELAGDLKATLECRPVRAMQARPLYVLGTHLRRHAYKAVGAAGIIAVLLATAGVAYVRVARERDRAATEARISRAVNDFLVQMLSSADPEGAGGRVPTLPEMLDRAAGTVGSAFRGQPLVEAAVRKTISDTYVMIGDAQKAEPHARAMVQLRIEALGESNPDALAACGDLAFVLYNSDRAPDAEAVLRPALDRARRALGSDHDVTLGLMRHLTSALYYQMRAADAEPLARESYQAILRLRGPDHPDSILAAEVLASVLTSTGALDEAEKLILGSIDRYPAHPQQRLSRLVHAYLRLGNLNLRRERFDEAENWLRKCVEARIEFYGSDHPNVAFAKTRLALLREQRGDAREAELLLRDAIAIDERVLPRPGRLIAQYIALARIARKHGREHETSEMLERAARQAAGLLDGESRPDYRFSLDYARGLIELKEHGVAAAFLTRVLERFERHLPADAPQVQTLRRLRAAASTQPAS